MAEQKSQIEDGKYSFIISHNDKEVLQKFRHNLIMQNEVPHIIFDAVADNRDCTQQIFDKIEGQPYLRIPQFHEMACTYNLDGKRHPFCPLCAYQQLKIEMGVKEK
jgi:hypothetical protein